MLIFKFQTEELEFDVETTIKVCRAAGYYKQALHLAEKHQQHDWYLKTQLEDIHDYEKALEYIARLDFEQVLFLDFFVYFSSVAWWSHCPAGQCVQQATVPSRPMCTAGHCTQQASVPTAQLANLFSRPLCPVSQCAQQANVLTVQQAYVLSRSYKPVSGYHLANAWRCWKHILQINNNNTQKANVCLQQDVAYYLIQ